MGLAFVSFVYPTWPQSPLVIPWEKPSIQFQTEQKHDLMDYVTVQMLNSNTVCDPSIVITDKLNWQPTMATPLKTKHSCTWRWLYTRGTRATTQCHRSKQERCAFHV